MYMDLLGHLFAFIYYNDICLNGTPEEIMILGNSRYIHK